MKAKSTRRYFVSGVVRVTKVRERNRVAGDEASGALVRPTRFLVTALPLRSQKKSA